ncbi:MAG: bifunctional hydroxymethylpyrimidine kinase/phosphomethylpyrimidine kinase [Actinomycetota bacterium]
MGQLPLIARTLTIAGSDPSGGAGIQQDLKTFAALGVWGLSAVTALTVQDTTGVARWVPVGGSDVRAQIDVVLNDIGCDAAKTGMLGTADVVDAVARAAADHDLSALVVDPVLVAGSGDALSTGDVTDAMKEMLLPRALIVTPNVHEASALAGLDVRTTDEQKEVAVALAAMGSRAVLVTGGHIDGETVTDVLFVEEEIVELSASRIDAGAVHGTGCLLSAAIAAWLAHGLGVEAAVRRARETLREALEHAVRIGKGAAVLQARR